MNKPTALHRQLVLLSLAGLLLSACAVAPTEEATQPPAPTQPGPSVPPTTLTLPGPGTDPTNPA